MRYGLEEIERVGLDLSEAEKADLMLPSRASFDPSRTRPNICAFSSPSAPGLRTRSKEREMKSKSDVLQAVLGRRRSLPVAPR
jgi:hypothetical protein